MYIQLLGIEVSDNKKKEVNNTHKHKAAICRLWVSSSSMHERLHDNQHLWGCIIWRIFLSIISKLYLHHEQVVGLVDIISTFNTSSLRLSSAFLYASMVE